MRVGWWIRWIGIKVEIASSCDAGAASTYQARGWISFGILVESCVSCRLYGIQEDQLLFGPSDVFGIQRACNDDLNRFHFDPCRWILGFPRRWVQPGDAR